MYKEYSKERLVLKTIKISAKITMRKMPGFMDHPKQDLPAISTETKLTSKAVADAQTNMDI